MTCSFRFLGMEFEKINKTSHLFCFVIAFYPANSVYHTTSKKEQVKVLTPTAAQSILLAPKQDKDNCMTNSMSLNYGM